jgi:hypothetical protein
MPRDHRGKPCARTSSPRPRSRWATGRIYVYDAATERVAKEPPTEFLKIPPGKVTRCRFFAENHADDPTLAAALERALAEEASSRCSRSESSPIFLMTT